MWRLPAGLLVAAATAVIAAAVLTLLWMFLTGMGHASPTSPLHLFWYLAIALVAGAAWLFTRAGIHIARAPTGARTIGVRLIGGVSYTMAALCAAFVLWALAVLVMW